MQIKKFYQAKKSFQNNHGFTISELLISSFIGIGLMLSVGSIMSDVMKAEKETTQEFDYLQFATDFRSDLKRAKKCDDLVPLGFVYDPNVGVELNGIHIHNTYDANGNLIQGPFLQVGQDIPNSTLRLSKIFIEPTHVEGEKTTIVFEDASLEFERHSTTINFVVEGRTSVKRARRPLPVAITLFTMPGTNTVQFCGSAASDEELCIQSGGVFYLPDEDHDSPYCDIRPAYGGCAKGGKFAYVGGRCDTVNPYTGSCSCPKADMNGDGDTDDAVDVAAFSAIQIADFSPSKSGHIKQYECLRCTGVTNATVNPQEEIYDEDALYEDLACQDQTGTPPDPIVFNNPDCPCHASQTPERCNCYITENEYSPDGGTTFPCKRNVGTEDNPRYRQDFCYSHGFDSCECKQQIFGDDPSVSNMNICDSVCPAPDNCSQTAGWPYSY